jgi:hypothetical protein
MQYKYTDMEFLFITLINEQLALRRRIMDRTIYNLIPN